MDRTQEMLRLSSGKAPDNPCKSERKVVQLVPRTQSVAPLSDEEILLLRSIIEERPLLAASCPIARKVLTGRPGMT